MANHSALSAVLLTVLLLSPIPASLAASKKPSAVARREDIPFIKCQVCEKLAYQIHAQVNKKQSDISPKKVSEFQIIEIAENICNTKKEAAEWIFQIDIVEKGDKLELVEQGTEGQCNSECKTIERACQEVLGYSDTDVAEFLFKTKPSADKLAKFLCNDLSKACSSKPPPVPKTRTPGEPFSPKPTKDVEMEKILRSMQGMPGAPSMKMYSRDDLVKNNFGDGEIDEDDDDEDEDRFPSTLDKVLKDSPKKNLKQKIMDGVIDTGAMVKKNVKLASQKVKKNIKLASRKIRKWWKGRKAGKKPPTTSKTEL